MLSKIRDLARKGIPQHFRTIAWQLLSNAAVSSTRDIYAECMRQSSPHEKFHTSLNVTAKWLTGSAMCCGLASRGGQKIMPYEYENRYI
uniref:Rab-GAP TBC domain-containing protein n=1 Tax=Parascaris equorum TaxID=6256 RepID=A0A914S758_PAREQ